MRPLGEKSRLCCRLQILCQVCSKEGEARSRPLPLNRPKTDRQDGPTLPTSLHIECKVFPKDACWQLSGWQLSFPVIVVYEWIAINGFVFSAVNTEICLTVAIQIELSQSDAAVDRFLEDSCNHASPVPPHFRGGSFQYSPTVPSYGAGPQLSRPCGELYNSGEQARILDRHAEFEKFRCAKIVSRVFESDHLPEQAV